MIASLLRAKSLPLPGDRVLLRPRLSLVMFNSILTPLRHYFRFFRIPWNAAPNAVFACEAVRSWLDTAPHEPYRRFLITMLCSNGRWHIVAAFAGSVQRYAQRGSILVRCFWRFVAITSSPALSMSDPTEPSSGMKPWADRVSSPGMACLIAVIRFSSQDVLFRVHGRPVTRQIYQQLRRFVPSLGIILACCGKPSHDLGCVGHFQSVFDELLHRLSIRGVTTVLTACPSCTKIFREYGKGLSVQTVYEVFQTARGGA